MLSSIGYGVWWALLMCLIIYGGSMQFAAVGLMASNASLLSAALLTVFINAPPVLRRVDAGQIQRDRKGEALSDIRADG